MNKISINFKIPFAIEDDEVINIKNGYKYKRRITKEFKSLQEICKNENIFINQKNEQNEKIGELHYKSLWINVDPFYVSKEIIIEVIKRAYECINTQTPSKHSFEKD